MTAPKPLVEQARETVEYTRRPLSLKDEMMEAFRASANVTALAHGIKPPFPVSAPIVNNDPPCPTMGVTDGENLTPEEIIHRARAEEQAEDIARHPDGFAAKLHRRTEQYRKHPERAAFDMLNAEELIRQLQRGLQDLRLEVGNIAQGGV